MGVTFLADSLREGGGGGEIVYRAHTFHYLIKSF